METIIQSLPYKIRDMNSHIFHHISTPYKIGNLLHAQERETNTAEPAVSAAEAAKAAKVLLLCGFLCGSLWLHRFYKKWRKLVKFEMI